MGIKCQQVTSTVTGKGFDPFGRFANMKWRGPFDGGSEIEASSDHGYSFRFNVVKRDVGSKTP